MASFSFPRVNATVLAASVSLITLAITNFYLTDHSSATLAKFFPGAEYIWLGAPGSKSHYDIVYNGSKDYHKVTVSYDWSTEYFVWASSGLSVLAGCVVGCVAVATMWRPKKVCIHKVFSDTK
jgi:hypothetical protein